MRKKVMVVDDSRIAYVQLSKLLEGSDYEIVQYCRDGRSALQAYELCRPDLVTMDIIMPDMDGFETAKALLGKWPEARILMASSLAYDETVDEAEEIGTKGFIYKPFEKESLLEAFQKALAD